MSRVIAFVGDLHVGSRFAVAPEGYRTKEKNVVRLNSGQKKLLEYFGDFCQKCDDFGVDTVFLMGDLIDGPNPKGYGRNLVVGNLNDQIEMAVTLLKELCKDRDVYGIEGSSYHVLPGGVSADQMVVQLLGGKWKGMASVCCFAPSPLTFFITHGTTQATVYRTTAMDKENLFINASVGIGKLSPIQVIVKAHRHFYLYMEQNGQYMLQVPCWITWVPNRIFLKLYGRMQPDIGACIVEVTEDGKLYHHAFLYDLPHIADRKEIL